MHPFLILSIGRTGTKWLAKTLGVDHEPKTFNTAAVSPRHLFMMTEGWSIPAGVRPLVMVRNAEHQMLSILNRAAALGPGKLTMFRAKIDRYLNILNGLVKQGAKVISFERLTTMSLEDLDEWAFDELGIEGVCEHGPQNQFPKTVEKLPPWASVVADRMQLHYNAWLEGHHLPFDPDVPDPTRHEIRYNGCVYRMDYVFPDEIVALRTHKDGMFQEMPVLEWVRHKKLKGTYIDVGAHVGNHSLFFANHCPSTWVLAIEAHPKIAALCAGNLERNVRNPDAYNLVQAAAWNESGKTVTMAPIPHNNAGHTCVQVGGPTEVPTVTIDELAKGSDRVAVLKIDVEDTEEEVLQGAMGTIMVDHPVIIAERHSREQLERFAAMLPMAYKRTAEWPGIHTYAWEAL